MTQAEAVVHELEDAQASLPPCEKCGGRLLIRYQPGLTLIGCITDGVRATLPDWQPLEISHDWNLHAG